MMLCYWLSTPKKKKQAHATTSPSFFPTKKKSRNFPQAEFSVIYRIKSHNYKFPSPRHDAASCAFICWPNIAVRTKDTRLLPRRILGGIFREFPGFFGRVLGCWLGNFLVKKSSQDLEISDPNPKKKMLVKTWLLRKNYLIGLGFCIKKEGFRFQDTVFPTSSSIWGAICCKYLR